MKLSQKRILSILAAAALTVCAVPQNTPLSVLQPALTACAETEEDFVYTVNEDGAGVTVTGWNGTDAEVVIPDTLGGLPVTAIGRRAFAIKEQITSVSVPDSITIIPEGAFNACTGLTEIDLPDTLTCIENDAFCGCSALRSIRIPDGVTFIGPSAFSGCTELADVTIPESVTSIGENAFRYSPWLAAQREQAADHLVIVNHNLLDGTTASGDVTVPNGVTRICGQAFSSCTALTGISLPDSVVYIDSDAFYNCKGLKSIVLQNGLKSIGARAFQNCSSLTAIDIPDSVSEIGTAAFFGCSKLADLHLPASLTAITGGRGQGTFHECSALTAVEIPEGVTSIGMMAFALCEKLEKVVIPRSVTEIQMYAFYGCSNLTVCGYAGTFAETYAQQNGYTFEALETEFSGISVTLLDDLGLNFFVSDVNADNKNDYKMIFDGKCEENGKDTAFTAKNGKFCATANISADHMNEKITAALYKKTEGEWVKIDTAVYSVNQYLKNAKPEANWSDERTDRFNTLVETVKLYGKVSYAYFNTPDEMSSFNVPSHTVAELTAAGLAPSFTSDDATLSLVLNSRTAVRLYIPGLTVGATADSGETAVKGGHGVPCFEITGITPLKLADDYEVEYGGKTYQFTPLSWCVRALDLDGGSPKNPVMADMLVEYRNAAQAYQAIM